MHTAGPPGPAFDLPNGYMAFPGREVMLLAYPLAPLRELEAGGQLCDAPVQTQGRIAAVSPLMDLVAADYHGGNCAYLTPWACEKVLKCTEPSLSLSEPVYPCRTQIHVSRTSVSRSRGSQARVWC